MVAMYNILGRQVGSHHLAIATLSTLFIGSYLSLSGGSKAAPKTPPINASSSDEADFIKKFLAEADAEEKKAKH